MRFKFSLEMTEDLKAEVARSKAAYSSATSKHGAGRSMDGLEQDAPATGKSCGLGETALLEEAISS
jgi:hypothetical protein